MQYKISQTRASPVQRYYIKKRTNLTVSTSNKLLEPKAINPEVELVGQETETGEITMSRMPNNHHH